MAKQSDYPKYFQDPRFSRYFMVKTPTSFIRIQTHFYQPQQFGRCSVLYGYNFEDDNAVRVNKILLECKPSTEKDFYSAAARYFEKMESLKQKILVP